MTTSTDVNTLLRALNPTEVNSEGDDFAVTIGRTSIKISGADVDAYLAAKPSLAHPSDTSLSAPGYHEQVIDIQGRGPLSWRLFRESEQISLKHPNNGFEITVGPVSTNLVFSLTDSDTIAKDLRRAVMMRRNPYREQENLNLRDLFSRIISVKIHAPTGHALFNNSRQLRALAEASLYHFAFGYGVSIIPIQSWERSFYALETRKKEVVQFPLRTYNSELVAYY